MLALCFHDAPRMLDVDAPEPGPGEALVRVTRAGICNTDLEIVRGYMGFRGILGHELVGVVESAPSTGLVGARVTGEINLPCGACPSCAAGLGRHCPHRTVLGILGKDGCFAERITLPVANLHRVPDDVSDEKAVFVEPLAAAFEILEQVHLRPSDRVAVLGDGKLGSLVAQVLLTAGGEVTLVGRHPERLSIAAGRGARTALADAPLEGRSFDVVVEATGSPSGLGRAQDLVRPRGTIVLKSTFHGRPEVDTARLVIDEITLLGSRCGPFAPALRALAEGTVDPSPLVEAVLPLRDGVEALRRAGEKGAGKIQLAMP
jgi:threonine dehydrogenase-like Zn-dependent dehydrogenase